MAATYLQLEWNALFPYLGSSMVTCTRCGEEKKFNRPDYQYQWEEILKQNGYTTDYDLKYVCRNCNHYTLIKKEDVHQRKRRSKKKKNKVKRQKTESDTDDSDEWEETSNGVALHFRISQLEEWEDNDYSGYRGRGAIGWCYVCQGKVRDIDYLYTEGYAVHRSCWYQTAPYDMIWYN